MTKKLTRADRTTAWEMAAQKILAKLNTISQLTSGMKVLGLITVGLFALRTKFASGQSAGSWGTSQSSSRGRPGTSISSVGQEQKIQETRERYHLGHLQRRGGPVAHW